MSPDADVVAHTLELLAPWGEVQSKRMFGGHGFFRQGLMFALIAEGRLYLKADDASRDRFEQQALPPFTYQRAGKEASLGYYLCPEDALETPAKMVPWADAAWQTALRCDEAKPPSQRKRQA